VIAPDLRSIGDTLLAAAGEAEIGLLVMGAHSQAACAKCCWAG
jgi:hypothetical protein